jgi:hypothetical protein
MYVCDSHGDLIDPAAADAALQFAERFQPEVRIHGGDAFDFRSLRNGASDDDRAEGVKEDMEQGIAFLKAYRPTVFLWGNHDDRPVQKAASCRDGNLRHLCQLLHDRIMDELNAIGCEVRPYDVEDGVYQWGGFQFVHGYNANMHSAHKAAQIYGNCIMGHVHGFQEGRPHRWDRAVGYTCGCLMDIKRATYARRRPATLTWQNGWLYGWEPAELAAEWNCCSRTASHKLKRLVTAGVVECERRRIVRHDGVIQRYAMYRFIE